MRSEPKPQPRPKACRVGQGIRLYTPTTASAFKLAVGMAAWEAFEDGELPLQGPVEIHVDFYLRRPKRLKGNDPEPHASKPDCDNLQKSCFDALGDAGIFSPDDCIIWRVEATKQYCARDAYPHADIRIIFNQKKDETA